MTTRQGARFRQAPGYGLARSGAWLSSQHGATARTSTVAHSAAGQRRGDVDRFIEAAAVDQEEAADHFLGLGKGAVEQLGLALAHLHAHRAGLRGQRLHREQLALVAQLLAEALHAGIGLAPFGRGARAPLPGRLDDQEHVGHEGPHGDCGLASCYTSASGAANIMSP
jgi:hypothetical protein